MVHNQIQSHDVSHCFHFYLLWLENNARQQTTFLFKIVLRCNLSWSTPSIWLCYSILSKTQGRNKCIIGVIYLSGWVMRDIFRWLYHSVSAPVSDRRSCYLLQWKEKCRTIQSDLLTGGRLPSRSTISFTQACSRLTSTKKKNRGDVSHCYCPLL